MNRRELLKSTGLAASVPAARAAANDRIGVGIIGCGGQGTWDQRVMQSQPDVEVVAVCDVYRPNLERARALAGGKARTYHDYRRLLEDRAVQAVVIATPEHWHALMCIDACHAGKDVYVEKPASHNIRDGRLMVEAARRNQRVVQVGSQQRSGSHFQRAVKFVQDGKLGRIHYAVCWNHSAPAASAARETLPAEPPSDLDYDLWLGPAPKRPFAAVWGRGRRLYWDFFGGMLTEWGSHLADVVLWAMEVRGPRTAAASGGQFHRREGEIPDTLEVLYEFDDFLLQYSVLSHNTFGPNGDAGSARFGSYGVQFHGTKGTLFVDRAGYRVTPQMIRHEDSAHPPRPIQWHHDERQFGYYYTAECLPEQGDSSIQHPPHVRNFLDCVKSRRRPNADIEDGHATNTVCRLGNIAYRVGRKLRWDAAQERVIGDEEAQRLAIGSYREPFVPPGL
jgi:predicted dehydrogenase